MNSELQKLFDEAVNLQSQGKNNEATALYSKITEQKVSSAALELNQALIFEKSRDWGKALARVDTAQMISRRPWLATDLKARIEKKVPQHRARFPALPHSGSDIPLQAEGHRMAQELTGLLSSLQCFI